MPVGSRRNCRRFGAASLAAGTAATLWAAPVAVGSGATVVRHVRSLPGVDVGITRPTGLAFAGDGSLLVAHEVGGRTVGRRVDLVQEEPRATRRLPGLANPATLTGARGGRVVAVGPRSLLSFSASGREAIRRVRIGGLRLRGPRGAALADAGRTLFVLDRGGRALVRVPVRGARAGRAVRIALRGVASQRLRGLALNPANGLLYTLSPGRDRLLAFDRRGRLRRTASVKGLGLLDPRALTFAPSADPTDHPAVRRLYIADRGRGRRQGRIIQAVIEGLTAMVAVEQVQATLIRTIDTSLYSPSSPDPSGITYLPGSDRLLISDGEVEEMSIYQGRNLFTATRTGSGTGTGTSVAYTKEPTGVGFDAATGTLYVTDDDADRISIVRAGGDGTFGTSDDIWTRISTSAYGIGDAEGAEFDSETGRLWVCDGVGTELYGIDPRNGVFGDGDDGVVHFDLAQHGARDCEGVGVDARRDSVVTVDPSTSKLFELTRNGTLVRVIDARNIPVSAKALAGLTVAPTSDPGDPASEQSYWVVDRRVDNGADPNENDGRLYEIAAPSDNPSPPADAPPTVSLTSPAQGATVSGSTTVTANAGDDRGVSRVQFSVDGTVIGTDTNGSNGWSAPWDTTAFADGSHTVTAVAEDTAGQTTSASRGVTVSNAAPDTTAPTVAVTAPQEGATVSGTTAVGVSASDDVGVASVEVRVDGTAIGTDTTAADGWSVSWNTTTVANGAHTITAVATDGAGNSTTSADVDVTVDNGQAPVVVSVPVRTGVDDADETVFNGAVRLTNGDLEFGREQAGLATIAGMRFTGVQVPAGAGVVSSSVQLTTDEVGKTATSLTIGGHASDNAPGITTAQRNLSGRTRTGALVAWNPPQWLTIGAAGPNERTPDIRTIVQELVNRPGWASGNALALIVDGSGRRTAETFEGGKPPVLRIEYVP